MHYSDVLRFIACSQIMMDWRLVRFNRMHDGTGGKTESWVGRIFSQNLSSRRYRPHFRRYSQGYRR